MKQASFDHLRKLELGKKPEKGEARCDYQEDLQAIAERLNSERKRDGFPPLSYGRIARELKSVKNKKAMHKECCTWTQYGSCYKKYKNLKDGKTTEQEANSGPATSRSGSEGHSQA